MGLKQRLQLRSAQEHEAYANSDNHDDLPTNKDLQPVPLGSPERTWTWPSLLGCKPSLPPPSLHP